MPRNHFLPFLGLMLGTCSIGSVPPCHAQLLYNVSLNTSSLVGHPAGPFSLDFQLIDGSGTGDANNTVTFSNFFFGGGSATGSPTLTGGTTGSLTGGAALTDSSFFNEFTQGFTPGSSLSFNVHSTGNVDAGSTPDEFSFAVLDKTGAEVPTTGLGDAFLIENIDSANPVAQPFGSDPSRLPAGGGPAVSIAAPTITSSVSAAPEPSSVADCGVVSLIATGLILKARKRKASSAA